MHIIHVTPTYFDEASVIGGGERYVDELAKAQARLPGTRVSIFSFGRQPRQYIKNGIHYRIFKACYWRHFTLNNPFLLGHAWALRRASVIHVHQLCTFVSDISVLAGRFWRIPAVGTDHGGGGAWVLNTRLPIYRGYQQVIAQSGQAAEPLERHFSGRVQVILGGVDLEYFTLPTDDAARQKEVLFVGRILAHKGVDLLINSFKQLNRLNWHLRIVGRPQNPTYFEKIKALAEGYPICFETDLGDDALVRTYQKARVTVLPSMRGDESAPAPELMGFTVLESQACGAPVVCSDAGPMREFIKEGETGWLFKSGDVMALVEGLRSAINKSESDHPELSKNCREHVARYSWNHIAKEHLKLYQRLIHLNVR